MERPVADHIVAFAQNPERAQPMESEARQARIRRGMQLWRVGRAARNQSGIDLVVLSPLQVKLRIGAHLCRLENDDHKALKA